MSSTKQGYKWYNKDWRNSRRVFKLSLAERGFYRELIDMAYDSDNRIIIEVDIWARMFGCSEKEINHALEKYLSLKDEDGVSMVLINENILSIPSCEPRLNLIRGGKKGGESSKPTPKPNDKPIEKPIVKPTPKHDSNQIEIENKKEIESIINKEEGGHFFYINGELIQGMPSQRIEEAHTYATDMWMMTTFKGIDKEAVLKRLDLEYIGYQFKDEMHLRNSFKTVADKMLKESKPSQTKKQYSQKQEQDAPAFVIGAKPKGAVNHD